MEFIGGAVLVSLLFIHIAAQRTLGQTALRFISSMVDKNCDDYNESFPLEFITGLLLYLLGVLIAKNVGVSWSLACFLPYILTLNQRSIKVFSESLRFPTNYFTWNRTPWLIVHILLGMSLFDYLGTSIHTPWKNSYGDLTYHLGMISSFVFGENFPPQQFIYAGDPLSYPFFINLWSAILWFWEPSWFLLSIIFLYQWVLLWSLVWEFLEGEQYPALPWLILFGGGTFFALQENSGQAIDTGLGFTSFLSTIWVPQRSSILGVVVALSVLHLFFRWEDNKENGKPLLYTGFILGLAPLAHTHICLTIGVFISIMLLIELIRDFARKQDQKTPGILQHICSFFVLSALSIHALPFLLEKQSFLKIQYAHFLMNSASSVSEGILLTLQNFLVPFALVIFLWISSRRHIAFITLCFVFSLAWIVRLSIWGWDHIKVFVACYLILLFLWKRLRKKSPVITALFIPLLLFPSFIELATIIYKGDNFTVYSRKQVKLAEEIRSITPKDSIILAAPKHNNPTLLTGRKLYVGYRGWLWSHDINHQERSQMQKDLYQAINCDDEICPDYLVYEEQGKKFWARKQISQENFERVGEEIYKIR